MALGIYRHNTRTGQCQLTRSLDRILEDAHLSGELHLSNRKLKDFPKSATKFDLSDTVIADLSRNRFCDLPEEITNFKFLETLLLYHNTIRVIPRSMKNLSSLTYLDLRSNHLSSLPREICMLPLQVLLIANNRLMALPDDLGRMERLTDLDASCNQIVNLPIHIGDLNNLKALSLRSNQLLSLPKEITYIQLVSLDISNNRISSLPVEIRQMTSLVHLNLDNNPLISPPANLCIRGLVHVLKFLDIQASKEDKLKSGCTYDCYTTLRRAPRTDSSITNKLWKQNTEFNTSSNDALSRKWVYNKEKGNISDLISPDSADKFPKDEVDITTLSNMHNTVKQTEDNIGPKNFNGENEVAWDDLVLNSPKAINKNCFPESVQTYREYKEALKQQRIMVMSNVYKPKTYDMGNETVSYNNETKQCYNKDEFYERKSSHGLDKYGLDKKLNSENHDEKSLEDSTIHLTNSTHTINKDESDNKSDCTAYKRPKFPFDNNSTSSNDADFGYSNFEDSLLKEKPTKSFRNVSWDQDVNKLSFTMRREFDKHREEIELISQLRTIIESRLKMTVPDDISSALTDGIILCHLANHIQPRSVASIHVPSHSAPKLTMAKCRKNVDNFLEACLKIGVDEEFIISCWNIISNVKLEHKKSFLTLHKRLDNMQQKQRILYIRMYYRNYNRLNKITYENIKICKITWKKLSDIIFVKPLGNSKDIICDKSLYRKKNKSKTFHSTKFCKILKLYILGVLCKCKLTTKYKDPCKIIKNKRNYEILKKTSVVTTCDLEYDSLDKNDIKLYSKELSIFLSFIFIATVILLIIIPLPN